VFPFGFLLVGYSLLYFLFITYKAVRQQKGGAKVIAAGIILYFVCTTNDMLSYLNVINSVRLSDTGFLILTFCMAIALAIQIAKVYRDREQAQKYALESQILLADSYARFVPRQFLVNLGKESILDVRLGDQVQKHMAIMFADIRSFTKLSESMTPRENFNFINSYLKRMSPIIQRHNGFIDKFLGDGIMALFETSTEDSLNAAIDMQKYIVEYNAYRSKHNYQPISIGIGIHTGNLMLGTIGSDVRMDGTVISDAVNLASRVEGLTKLYGIKIATSDETLSSLSDKERYKHRFIDRVKVVGKDRPVNVIEIMDGDDR
jgi:adenylate cyclase